MASGPSLLNSKSVALFLDPAKQSSLGQSCGPCHRCQKNQMVKSRLSFILQRPAAAAQRSFAEPSVIARNRLMYLAPSLL